MRTEDHPLAYGSFEGTIPKGEYGGGTVMMWDQGTWEPKGDPRAGLKKGHLAFDSAGERLKGGWDMIRMRGDEKRENWLLIKETDEEAGDQRKREVSQRTCFKRHDRTFHGRDRRRTGFGVQSRSQDQAANGKQDEKARNPARSCSG